MCMTIRYCTESHITRIRIDVRCGKFAIHLFFLLAVGKTTQQPEPCISVYYFCIVYI